MEKNSGYIKRENLLFSPRLKKAVTTIITKNLGLLDDDSLLIIYDTKKIELANIFEKVAVDLNIRTKKLKIPISKVNGAEPPIKAAAEIKKYVAAIFLTQNSLSHTKARRNASNNGVRIASMPGITKSILKRSIDIDYNRLKNDSKRLASLLNNAVKVRITTRLGTDITFSIRNRKSHGLSAGIYDKNGKWGNLPEGEIFIAPVEETANGHFVVDGSIAGFGKITHPLIFIVNNGYVTKIMDGKKPPKIEELLNSVGKKARNIAEFGIGLNRKAKVTGVVLEDEKSYGTCHIALGNNIGFGGKVDVPLHIDCVIKKPTIYLNNKIVMKKGKIIL